MNVSKQACDEPRVRGLPGFSLTELMVVLGLILVVLSLTLPALRAAKQRGAAAACLASMHQSSLCVSMYAHQSRDTFPYALRTGFLDPFTGQRVRLDSPYVPYSYTWVGDYWHTPMLADYFGGDPFNKGLYCPGYDLRQRLMQQPGAHARAWATGISLSMAMFLAPEALDPAAPRWRPEVFKVMRVSDVAAPLQKAMLFETAPAHDPHARGVGGPITSATPWKLNVIACDGSGTLRDHRESVEGVVFPNLDHLSRKRFDGQTETFSFTPHGVRGRDW